MMLQSRNGPAQREGFDIPQFQQVASSYHGLQGPLGGLRVSHHACVSSALLCRSQPGRRVEAGPNPIFTTLRYGPAAMASPLREVSLPERGHSAFLLICSSVTPHLVSRSQLPPGFPPGFPTAFTGLSMKPDRAVSRHLGGSHPHVKSVQCRKTGSLNANAYCDPNGNWSPALVFL